MSEHQWRFSLRRVRLNGARYDKRGFYWGVGRPLYIAIADDCIDECTADDWPEDIYLRAETREDAKHRILAIYKNATFYR